MFNKDFCYLVRNTVSGITLISKDTNDPFSPKLEALKNTCFIKCFMLSLVLVLSSHEVSLVSVYNFNKTYSSLALSFEKATLDNVQKGRKK